MFARPALAHLAEVLPWGCSVAPGILLNVDGALQTSWRYRGPDPETLPASAQAAQMLQIHQALLRLGSGCALWCEAQRLPTPVYTTSDWPTPASACLDAERRQAAQAAGAQYDSTYVLTVTWLPPSLTTRRVRSWVTTPAPSVPTQGLAALLDAFRTQMHQVSDLLRGALVELTPLNDEETLTYLHSTISLSRQTVRVPAVPVFLSDLLADTPLAGGLAPRLGGAHLRTITITGFPDATQAHMLHALTQLPLAYRWVTRWVPLETQQALRAIDTVTRHWRSTRLHWRGLLTSLLTQASSGPPNRTAAYFAEDAAEARHEVASGQTAYGYVTTTVTVWNDDAAVAEEAVRAVERVITQAGCVCHRETFNAVEAWLGSLPGQAHANIRRPLLSAVNLAHLVPMAAPWAGPPRNAHLDGPPLCQAHSAGHTPFHLITHVGNVGHTFVCGPTGAGKSALLTFLAAQFLRYPGAQIFYFDVGASARAITLGQQGAWYDLGGETASLALQPLAGIDQEAERRWAADWVCDLLAQEQGRLTPQVTADVWEALQNLATAPRAQRTLTGLQLSLRSPALRAALVPWGQGGPYAALLDAQEEAWATTAWYGFEMGPLLALPRAVRPVLLCLFHRLEQRLRGQPSLIILDEAWRYLDTPAFAEHLRGWLKTLRKVNTSVWLATQSIADVAASALAPVVFESCPTRLLLPNPAALEPYSQDLYRGLGLNEAQIQLLASAIPKRQYYYSSPLGSRLFDLPLGEVALALCGASRPEDQTAMTAVLREHGAEGFLPAWLRHKGVTPVA